VVTFPPRVRLLRAPRRVVEGKTRRGFFVTPEKAKKEKVEG